MYTKKEIAKYTEEYTTVTLTFNKSEGISEVIVTRNISGELRKEIYKFCNLDSARLRFLQIVTTYIRKF